MSSEANNSGPGNQHQNQHEQKQMQGGDDGGNHEVSSSLHSVANLGERIWDSIITPGTAPGLLLVINIATVGMLLCLVFTILIGYGNIHVYALGGLGLGLLASVNWFVHEMWAFEAAQKEEADKKK